MNKYCLSFYQQLSLRQSTIPLINLLSRTHLSKLMTLKLSVHLDQSQIHQLVLVILSKTMIRKGAQQNSNKLDKITQVNHNEVPHQATTSSPSLKNRISLGSVITRQPSKKNAVSMLGQQYESIKQKQNLIKQLQQQITIKKQKNDAVQEAFRMRQQYTIFFNKSEQPQKRMRSIAIGAGLLAGSNNSFKRALLKQLRLVFREWKTDKCKAVKYLLLWIMGWINNMFSMLGRSLTF